MKYKCNDCGHIFESTQTVFECPKCGGVNIAEVGGFFNKYKKIIVIMSVIIAALLLLKMCNSNNETTVNVKYDHTSQRLEVELKGAKIDEYNIIITREGDLFTNQKFKDKSLKFTFSVPGEYRLQVKYTGSDKMPKLSTYPKGPWIVSPQVTGVEPAGVPITPQILDVRIQNTNINTNTYTVKVVTNVNAVPLSETVFSLDNSTYQSSDTFNNLSPGFYTFYARNTRDNTLIDQFQFNLPTPPSPTNLSDAELNQLLIRIARGDDNAVRNWREEVEGPPAIIVEGMNFIADSYALRQHVRTQGVIVTVHTQRDGNNKILKIIVN